MKYGIEPISTRDFGKVGLLETTTTDRIDADKIQKMDADRARKMLESLDDFFDK